MRKNGDIKSAFLIFLLLLTYDGTLRKWAFPEAEQLLFILKDAVLVILFLYVVLVRATTVTNARVPPVVHLMLGLYALWVVIQAFNPNLPNLLVGVWGVKAHLLYASLILLLPLLFVDLRDALSVLARIYPWLVIPVCSLAFLQLTLPADHFFNQQARGGLEGIAYFGEANLVRVAGPFSYISGMAAFAQFSALLGLGLYLAGVRSLFFLAGFASSLMVLPATGSRAVVMIAAVGATVMLLGGTLARLVSRQDLLRALLTLGVLLAVSLATQDSAWEAFQQRFDANREEGAPRIITAFTNAFAHFDVAGLLGFGSGAANLGAVAFVPGLEPFYWLPVGFEEESGRIVLELGILGWALSLLMRLSLLFWATGLVLRGSTPACRLAGMFCLPFMALGVLQGNGVFAASYMAVAYWFYAALLAMAEHEHQRALATRRSALARQFACR